MHGERHSVGYPAPHCGAVTGMTTGDAYARRSVRPSPASAATEWAVAPMRGDGHHGAGNNLGTRAGRSAIAGDTDARVCSWSAPCAQAD